MTDIDYEALAKAGCLAGYEGWPDNKWDEIRAFPEERKVWNDIARAVVAALAEQGLVVARKDDLSWLLSREQGNLRLATRRSDVESRVQAAIGEGP